MNQQQRADRMRKEDEPTAKKDREEEKGRGANKNDRQDE
jgi:hypothetical protein